MYFAGEYASNSAYGEPIAPSAFVTTALRTPTWWPDERARIPQLPSLLVPLDVTSYINVSVEQADPPHADRAPGARRDWLLHRA
jgi:hypothetical protein